MRTAAASVKASKRIQKRVQKPASAAERFLARPNLTVDGYLDGGGKEISEVFGLRKNNHNHNNTILVAESVHLKLDLQCPVCTLAVDKLLPRN